MDIPCLLNAPHFTKWLLAGMSCLPRVWLALGEVRGQKHGAARNLSTSGDRVEELLVDRLGTSLAQQPHFRSRFLYLSAGELSSLGLEALIALDIEPEGS